MIQEELLEMLREVIMKRGKQWIDGSGNILSEADLKKVSSNWDARMWEEFLSSTVEKPLRESHLNRLEESSISDECKDTYQELLHHEEAPSFKLLVHGLLRCLTLREHKIIYGYFWEGKSQYELAKELKITRSTVRNYLERSLKKLGTQLLQKVSQRKGLIDQDAEHGPHESAQNYIGKKKVS
jgi:RNA polymerase sigma factor (sigma-70 family)